MFKYLVSFFCFVSIIMGQALSVQSISKLVSNEKGEFYYPKFSPDDKLVLLTSSNYIGLWTYDFTSKKITQLNYYRGAGYKPKFTGDGKRVIFKADIYMGNRSYSSLILQNLISKKETLIEQRLKKTIAPEILSDGEIFYTDEFTNDFIHLSTHGIKHPDVQSHRIAYSNNSNIVLYSKEKKIIKPLGDGKYLWVSISPDGSKILFNYAGRGTFISNLQGNIEAELGLANAPKWSPDGKWITYMADVDDGTRVTGSEIFVVSSDGLQKVQITSTQDVKEMYPEWNSKGTKLICNSVKGEIYLINLTKGFMLDKR